MTAEKLEKITAGFGVPWETAYGYMQAVQVKDTIYLSGQLSHDASGAFVAPASLDEHGRPRNFSTMEAQFRQTYLNASELLARFGATLEDVVEETLFVLDVPSAFVAAGKVRKEVYGTAMPKVASNLIGVTQLAFPEQLVEVTFRAILKASR